jgi:hypothetical protein
MKDTLNRARLMLLFYKMAITRFVLFVVFTATSSIQAALAGADWSRLSPQARFLIVVSVIGSCSVTIMAFLDQTMQKISKGETPLAQLDTKPEDHPTP